MLSIGLTFPSLPDPFDWADLVAFVTGITANITGTISNSDIGAGAVTPAKVTPGAYFYAGASHIGAMAFTMTLNPALTALTEGAVVYGRTTVAIDSAATLNVNGLGAKKWMRANGVDFRAGELRSGQSFAAQYNTAADSSAGAWILLSESAEPHLDCYQAAVSTMTNTVGTDDYVSTFSPTVYALTDGTRVRFKVPTVNAGASTFKADGLTKKPIKKLLNVAMAAGDLAAGMMVELTYDATNDWWQLMNPSAQAQRDNPVIGMARTLLVRNDASAPNSQITLTADEIVLKNADGTSYLARNVSLTLNITTSGPNGLDATSEASSTWYYIWVIAKADGTLAGLLSTSATAPALPTGYTFKALQSQAYNDGGSDLDPFYQVDRTVYIQGVKAIDDTTGSTTYASLSMAAIVPPNAREVFGIGGATSANNVNMAVAADAVGMGEVLCHCNAITAMPADATAPGLPTFTGGSFFRVPLKSASTLYWKTQAATVNAFGIVISGFVI